MTSNYFFMSMPNTDKCFYNFVCILYDILSLFQNEDAIKLYLSVLQKVSNAFNFHCFLMYNSIFSIVFRTSFLS